MSSSSGSKRKRGTSKGNKQIPVTVLSGFLGAGKTTTLNHLLEQGAKKSQKYAVIVNDMSIVNIDAQFIKRTTEKVIELSNGCICCTLREDLVEQLLEISDSYEAYDAIIIESTGIGEPLHIAETFSHILTIADSYEEFIASSQSAPPRKKHNLSDNNGNQSTDNCTETHCEDSSHNHETLDAEGGNKLEISASQGKRAVLFKQRVRLDTMVTVVDASQVWNNFKSTVTNKDSCAAKASTGPDATAVTAEETATTSNSSTHEPTISDLLLDQVQFANIIIVNKLDLLSAVEDDESYTGPTVDDVMGLLQDLNPMATLLPSEHGNVKLTDIVNTKQFSFEEAAENKKWFESEWGESTPESDEYGVSSIVITSTRPFHPQRLYDFIVGSSNLHLLGRSSTAASTITDEDTAVASTSDSASTLDKHTKTVLINQIIRAKGYIWLSCQDDICIVLQIAGSNLSMAKGSPWWCTVPKEKWPKSAEFKAEIIDTMHKVWGDRRQRLVVIGVNMEKKLMREAFESCLLTDIELEDFVNIRATCQSAHELMRDPFNITKNADVQQANDRSSSTH